MLSVSTRFKMLQNEFTSENQPKFVPKIEKATKMVRDQPNVFYRLENDGGTLIGVVKSQRNTNLLYAPYIRSDGSYGCQTQNLNSCGGLRGSVCKHILTLVVTAASNKTIMKRLSKWIANSVTHFPFNDKEMTQYIFEQFEITRQIRIEDVLREQIRPRVADRPSIMHHHDNFPVPSTIKIIDALIQGEVSIQADGNLQNVSHTISSIGTGEKITLDKAIELGWKKCSGCEQWFDPIDQDGFKDGTECPSSMLGLAHHHSINLT